MGLPDTYVMPVPNTKIFTATSAESSNTQEHIIPSLTQNFNKNEERHSACHEGDYSYIFTCGYIKKTTNIRKFTPEEIQKATNNFYAEITIGPGKFYKGMLPNNQLIAVRRTENSTQGIKECVNEIIILSQINNTNVIKFLGCCFETDVPSIVFEYIPNRTLYDHLFDEQNTCLLTWNDRLRIAAEVAQVLSYLHTTVKIPIIHRDIKSMSIVLDENYTAKVCEFGISMPLLRDQNEFNESVEDTWGWDGMETSIMGTYGYADPEYIETGKLSKKSDVYSFGVVLAELLTRQKAYLRAAVKEEDRLLPFKFLEGLKHGRLMNIFDKQLVNKESMGQVKKVAHIAGRCLQLKGENRPTMSQVVTELQEISGL